MLLTLSADAPVEQVGKAWALHVYLLELLPQLETNTATRLLYY